MGGGLSRHELAAAVSEAGGLGTIAVNGAAAIERELAAARALTGRAARGQRAAALRPPRLVRGRGSGRRRRHLLGPAARGAPPGVWIHQCGSVAEARAAHAAGADAAIVQGVEAGGHVRGSAAGAGAARAASGRRCRPTIPLLLAGGIAERADVAGALEAGAGAAVAGTRFLLSDESRAHPELPASACSAPEETILTELFGLGWPAPHRVVANAATARWLGDGARVPGAEPASLNRLSAPGRPLDMPASTPGSPRPRPAARQPPALTAAARPTTARRACSTPARSTPARPWPASTTVQPGRGARRRRCSAAELSRPATTATSSRANLPFASSGSPSG